MGITRIQAARPVFTQLGLFFALSRTPHGLIDLATPVLTAILWYGGFPPARVLWLGILTAFAGYTCVYALNDLVDYRTDRQRFVKQLMSADPVDLDSIFLRHPIASGSLSPAKAAIWASAWGIVAVVGAWLLNPLCILIFLAACCLEAIYCLAWQASCFKVFVSGAVKTAGPLAAIYAVDPNPSPYFVALVFLWLFFWEVGGQNIPNDWSDIDEDREMNASTFPVRFGETISANIVLICLFLTLCLGVVTISRSGVPYGFACAILSAIAAVYLLILPALNLNRLRDKKAALALFNRASYYPAAMLGLVIAGFLLGA
ncbi:MAG: UbiA prenyltransferase [Deltaproteobacteria bacterium]|nr:UbiA prenyltransferase [Deltaproteobacteria bacterium]